MQDYPSWICCQIGAREHYAVPRSLLRHNRSVRLITDAWAFRLSSPFLPPRWKQRRHADIPDQIVKAFNFSLTYANLRRSISRASQWARIVAQNEWFEHAAGSYIAQHLGMTSSPPTVFAYSYAAKHILATARRLGCFTVLGQIDPGPLEAQIVSELERQHGLAITSSPPEAYWDHWRAECDVADAIVVNSDWSRRGLIREGIPPRKIHTVPLAFDSPNAAAVRRYPETFTHARPLRVLFLGQVIARKGIFELTDAIRMLAGRPVHWTIVGPIPQPVREKIGRLPQTDTTGPITRHEASSFYQAADVFILPTHSDGFALTQLEAVSWRLPIIASKCCGDVVMHGHTGLILDAVTSEAIAAAIERLLASPGLLTHMSASQSLADHFTMESVGRQLISLDSLLRN